MSDFPAENRPSREVLRDGRVVLVRLASARDAAAMERFVAGLSPEALELRFFSPVAPSVAVAELLPAGPAEDRESFVLERTEDGPGEIVGQAEWVRSGRGSDRAEVAFVIADRFQGVGAGTVLLRALARRARARGVRYFEAVSVSENRPMIDVFRGAGYPCRLESDAGELRVLLDIRREPPEGFALGTPVDSPLDTAA